MISQIFLISFLVLSVDYIRVDATLDLTIKKYEMCPDMPDTPIKHHASVTKFNSTIMLADGDATVPEDITEDVTVKLMLHILKNGEWKEFKNLEEKNPCVIFNKYGGDMWFDLQEKVGVQKGVCPLPKGDYKVTGHVLDFTKLPVKSGPNASLKAKFQLVKEDKVLLCMDVEVDSV